MCINGYQLLNFYVMQVSRKQNNIFQIPSIGMYKSKKTPMYESTTSPNDAKAYDFVDFTAPAPQPSPPEHTIKQSNLIKKIEALYKSQLLNIEESKEEDAHVDDETKQNSQTQERVLGDMTNIIQPFSRILRLNTYQTLGTDEPCDDQVITGPASSYHSSCPFSQQPFHVRRSKTLIQDMENLPTTSKNEAYYYEREPDYTPSYSVPYSWKPIYSESPHLSSYNSYNNYSGSSLKSNGSSSYSYFAIMGDYTSDDLIRLMPDPYRSSLEQLKSRVKSKSQPIL